MSKNHYTITEAANLLKTRTHTLRYWEEELDLHIPRNEMGHRVYYDEQIEQFQTIRKLKDQGFQLNAIHMQLQDKFPIQTDQGEGEQKESDEKKEVQITARNPIKLEQFQALMNEVVKQAMVENNRMICSQVEDRILKQMDYLFQMQDRQAEERYHKLDEAIRQSVRAQHFAKHVRKTSGAGESRFIEQSLEMPEKKKTSGKYLFGKRKEAVTKCSHMTGTL